MSPSENITFQCPACSSKLTVPAHLAGVTGPCPYCQSEIAAPNPAGNTGAQLIRPSEPIAAAADATPPPTSAGMSPESPSPMVSPAPGHGGVPSPPDPRAAAPDSASVPPPESARPPGATPDATSPLPPGERFPEPPEPDSAGPSAPPLEAGPDAAAAGSPPPRRDPRRRRRGFPVAPAIVGLVVLAAAAGGAYYWAFLRPDAGSPDPLTSRGDTSGGVPPAVGENGEESPADTRGGLGTSPTTDAPDASSPAGTVDPEGAAPPSTLVVTDPSERSMPLDPGSTSLAPDGPDARPDPSTSLEGSPGELVIGDEGTAVPSGAGFTSSPTESVDASILEGPRSALMRFLGAASWDERLAFVQNPDQIAPRMKAYHEESKSPDGPVPVSSVTFQNSERVPDTDYHFFLFHITTEEVPEGFPVSVEETGDGFRVDWEAFIEFNDLLLYKFMETPQPGTKSFHVIMRRAHYFGSDVPDIENKYAFRIEPPIPGYEGFAFVPKDSPLVEEKLAHQLQWPAISYPIVELRWAEAGDSRFIELVDVVQNTWRSDDSARADSDGAGPASASR